MAETGKVVDLLDNGKVVKHLIVEGEGDYPQVGNEVTVHYVGTLADGTEFDSSRKRGTPFKFQIGVQQVIKGWDVGVMAMKRGEKSKLVIQPDFGYGAAGAPPTIPPNAELHFEVELIDFGAKRKERNEMTTEERLAACEESRAAGNNAYCKGEYQAAIIQYRDAVDMLEGCWNWPEALAQQAAPLLISGNLNLAMCYLKLEAWREASLAATAALQVDKENVKALYRRGLAHIGLGELEFAKNDLLKAAQKEPQNPEIRKQLERCKELQRTYNAQSQGFYKKMFK